MRSSSKSIALILGFVSALGLTRCSPMATSLQKNSGALGGSLSKSSSEESLKDTTSSNVSARSAKVVPQPKGPGIFGFGDGPANSADLAQFQGEGKIEISLAANEEPLDVEITIHVNLSEQQIQDLKLNPLPMSAVHEDGKLYFVVASQESTINSWVKAKATAIRVEKPKKP